MAQTRGLLTDMLPLDYVEKTPRLWAVRSGEPIAEFQISGISLKGTVSGSVRSI